MKIYSLFLLTIFNSCITGNISVKTGIEEISFRNGGGFTGAVKTYILKADGTLHHNETQLKKIDKKTTLELFQMAKELKDYSFNEPDNMYSFIEIKTKAKTNRIVWGFASKTINTTAIQLHNKITTLTK